MNGPESGSAFLGRGWCFPPEFDRRLGETAMVAEEEDIRESLRILLATSPGERLMHPSYGCALRAMVFENIDETAATLIKEEVERAVLFFEPRIALDRVAVEPVETPTGKKVEIHLAYTVRTINRRNNMVYPFYVEAGAGAESG